VISGKAYTACICEKLLACRDGNLERNMSKVRGKKSIPVIVANNIIVSIALKKIYNFTVFHFCLFM